MRRLASIVVIAGLVTALDGCASLTPPPSEAALNHRADVEALEREIHRQINQVRRQHGLEKLAWDTDLAAIARGHSVDMGARDYFDHASPEGSGPNERAAARDFRCRRQIDSRRSVEGIAENIYQTYQYRSVSTRTGPLGERRSYDWKTLDEVARDVVQGWMESPGHRANILNAIHEAEGIGVARMDDYAIFVTQNLC